MKHMKIFSYTLCGLVFSHIHGVSAQETRSCDDRANELKDSFAAKYIELEQDCYPAQPSPDAVTLPDGGAAQGNVYSCEFKLSPECVEKYDALNTEVTRAWDALFLDCPDLLKPIPIDAPADSGGELEPSFKAPTKGELLKRVKSLESKLRRAKQSKRRLSRQCRK